MTADTGIKGRPPGYTADVHVCTTGGLTVQAMKGRFTHLHRPVAGSMRIIRQKVAMDHQGFLRWRDPTGTWRQKAWVPSNLHAKSPIVDEMPAPPPGPPVQDIDAAIRYAYLGRTPGDLEPRLQTFLETTEALAMAVSVHQFRTQALGNALMAYEEAREKLLEGNGT